MLGGAPQHHRLGSRIDVLNLGDVSCVFGEGHHTDDVVAELKDGMRVPVSRRNRRALLARFRGVTA